MRKNHTRISYRPIETSDYGFLFNLYASSRLEELSLTTWSHLEKELFLRQQFNYQHDDYMKNYKNAQFNIIVLGEISVGRLYVDRRTDDIRILDIALMPKYQKQGIGSTLLNTLIQEANCKNVLLSLHVEPYNPALHLYKRLNFKKKNQNGIYFLMERQPDQEENTQ